VIKQLKFINLTSLLYYVVNILFYVIVFEMAFLSVTHYYLETHIKIIAKFSDADYVIMQVEFTLRRVLLIPSSNPNT
jgi:hypothetical protein